MEQAVRCSSPTTWVTRSRLCHYTWVSWRTKRSLGRFYRHFSRFPLPQISFHHFSTLIPFISIHLILSVPRCCVKHGRPASLLFTNLHWRVFVASHPRPQLWHRSNVLAFNAAGSGWISDRVNFLVQFFPEFFLNPKINIRKFGLYSSPGIIWPSQSFENIFIRLRTATVSDLSCSICPSLNKDYSINKIKASHPSTRPCVGLELSIIYFFTLY